MKPVKRSCRLGHTHIWRIENFSVFNGDPGTWFRSDTFATNHLLDETYWYVKLYPRGQTSDLSDFVTFALIRSSKDDGPKMLDIEPEALLVASDGTETFSSGVRLEGKFGKHEKSCVANFVRRDTLFKERERYLPGDTLTVKIRLWKIDQPQVPSMTTALTGVKFEKKCFTWDIENFGVSHDERSISISTSFEPDLFDMFLNSSNKNGSSTCAEYTITIRQKVNSDKTMYVDGRVTVLDSTNEKNKLLSAEGSHVFPDHCIGHKWTFPSFINVRMLEAEKDKFMPGGVLQLHCDFTIFSRNLEPLMEESSILPEENFYPEPTLVDDVKSLYQTREFADVILRVDKRHTFTAHKWILSARSAVFLNMFLDMELEKDTNEIQMAEVEDAKVQDDAEEPGLGNTNLDVVKLVDVEPRTLKRLLKFVYTDTLDVKGMDFDGASSLYSAAIRFEIPLLRLENLALLKSMLNFNNVYRALVLAEVVGQPQLRIYAQDYIDEHREEVLLSNDWQDFVVEQPSLASQVICHLRLRDKGTSGRIFAL